MTLKLLDIIEDGDLVIIDINNVTLKEWNEIHITMEDVHNATIKCSSYCLDNKDERVKFLATVLECATGVEKRKQEDMIQNEIDSYNQADGWYDKDVDYSNKNE